MFPKFMGGDDTEETNSEDRPLYTLCGKDNMDKPFGHTWCFIPFKVPWVYTWIFANAMPILHPVTATRRVQQCSTYAYNQETRAVEYVCGKGTKKHKVSPMHIIDIVDGTRSNAISLNPRNINQSCAIHARAVLRH